MLVQARRGPLRACAFQSCVCQHHAVDHQQDRIVRPCLTARVVNMQTSHHTCRMVTTSVWYTISKAPILHAPTCRTPSRTSTLVSSTSSGAGAHLVAQGLKICGRTSDSVLSYASLVLAKNAALQLHTLQGQCATPNTTQS